MHRYDKPHVQLTRSNLCPMYKFSRKNDVQLVSSEP